MSKMIINEILVEVLRASEKAASIAKIIRTDSTLLSLLVEEKSESEKNSRFVKDFKTLADVVVQEVVKYDLNKKFPGIDHHVFGEESNSFSNSLGESITFAVQDSQEATAELLASVLSGHRAAADTIAALVHSDINIAEPKLDHADFPSVSLEDIGVWIDPLDSTNQYINGTNKLVDGNSLLRHSLESVLVLIGVFSVSTGRPLLGVINQPFTTWHQASQQWSGRQVWGIAYGGCRVNSEKQEKQEEQLPGLRRVAVSKAENLALLDVLRKKFDVVTCSGAGYKLLCLLDGKASLYVLQLASSYKWDICAAHAVLCSMGEGGIVDMRRAVGMWHRKGGATVDEIISECQVAYSIDASKSLKVDACNEGGIIGYINRAALAELLDSL